MEFAPEGPMAIPLWINGRAYLTVGERFFDVVNPSTGQALRRVPLCGADEAGEAVAAARDAQPTWAAMGLPAREVCLSQLAEALDRYAGHFAKLITQDTGADETRAASEVVSAVAALRSGRVGETGVLGLVADASQPLAGWVEALVPGLLAGATWVLKPSPQAPSAAYAFCELTARVEWPAGVLNLLQGDSAAIQGLCAAGIDRLVFAGAPSLAAPVGEIAAAAGVAFEARQG